MPEGPAGGPGLAGQWGLVPLLSPGPAGGGGAGAGRGAHGTGPRQRRRMPAPLPCLGRTVAAPANQEPERRVLGDWGPRAPRAALGGCVCVLGGPLRRAGPRGGPRAQRAELGWAAGRAGYGGAPGGPQERQGARDGASAHPPSRRRGRPRSGGAAPSGGHVPAKGPGAPARISALASPRLQPVGGLARRGAPGRRWRRAGPSGRWDRAGPWLYSPGAAPARRTGSWSPCQPSAQAEPRRGTRC